MMLLIALFLQVGYGGLSVEDLMKYLVFEMNASKPLNKVILFIVMKTGHSY